MYTRTTIWTTWCACAVLCTACSVATASDARLAVIQGVKQGHQKTVFVTMGTRRVTGKVVAADLLVKPRRPK